MACFVWNSSNVCPEGQVVPEQLHSRMVSQRSAFPNARPGPASNLHRTWVTPGRFNCPSREPCPTGVMATHTDTRTHRPYRQTATRRHKHAHVHTQKTEHPSPKADLSHRLGQPSPLGSTYSKKVNADLDGGSASGSQPETQEASRPRPRSCIEPSLSGLASPRPCLLTTWPGYPSLWLHRAKQNPVPPRPRAALDIYYGQHIP